jgi:DNA helicase IV
MELNGLINAKDLADNFAEVGDRATTAEQAATDRTWIYGHVVIDEAQELSPMQWRMLRRRCPHRSFTVVGDIAQAASASAAGTWQDALHPLVGTWTQGDRWHLEELTVNYRTPSQIASAAESMAIAHGLPVTESTSVRQSEWPITILGTAAEAIRSNEQIESPGTVAVIANAERVPSLAAELSGEFGTRVSLGAEGLTTPISVLSPQDAKGLEFDSVIVVDPARIVDETSRGAAALYVAMTRPTQRLWLVEAERLPAGLSVPAPAMAG